MRIESRLLIVRFTKGCEAGKRHSAQMLNERLDPEKMPQAINLYCVTDRMAELEFGETGLSGKESQTLPIVRAFDGFFVYNGTFSVPQREEWTTLNDAETSRLTEIGDREADPEQNIRN